MHAPTSTTELVDSLEQYDDVLSWINDTLLPLEDSEDVLSSSTIELTELDRNIAHLLATLDIASEDTSSHLERIIDEVARGIPRLTYDLHFMKDGSSALQTSLEEVLQKSKEAIPDATSVALDHLHYLDTIKVHMEASREVLREAESWSTLELEVTSLIGEHSYSKAAERMSEASKSMVVFQNTPEYDPRRTLMVNLQNQLEASLSSALVSAINSQDIVSCKEYFSIFSVIQRESEFRNYYYASRRSPILTQWQNVQLADCGPTSGTHMESLVPFIDFLQKFYASFLSILNTERKSIFAIFPDPAFTLSQFISSTLTSLQPTFSQRLSSLVAYHGELSLSKLILALRATEEFAIEVSKIMEKVNFVNSNSSHSMGGSEKPGHVRRRSSRMSISLRPGQHRSSPSVAKTIAPALVAIEAMEWDQELFQPFIDYQVDYSSLERRFLDQTLNNLIAHDPRDKFQDVDQPRLLRERAVDIFGIAEGSLTRCSGFTHGYAVTGLVHALDSFLQSFIDSSIANIQNQTSNSSSTIPSSISEGDLSDLDYSSEDWSAIQLFLHLLTSGRAIHERLTAFETRLRSFLAQTATEFRLAQTDPVSFLIAPSRGESQLLEQSPLNSAELHAMLDSLEYDQPHPSNAAPSPSLRPAQNASQAAAVEFLLLNARKALHDFALTCQMALQKTIISPLRKHLVSYASSPLWSAESDSQTRRKPNELQVPTFSLSPTETMQRVAEGLLNLPRLFEVYADDDALAFSLQSLPHLDSNMLKGLSEQPSDTSNQQSHRRRSSISTVKPLAIDPEVVSSAWLLSLGCTFLEHLVTSILPDISLLSSSGAAQLASDLEYLSNIARALNVEHGGLEKWRTYTSISDDEGKKALIDGDSTDLILRRVAKQRGWEK